MFRDYIMLMKILLCLRLDSFGLAQKGILGQARQ